MTEYPARSTGTRTSPLAPKPWNLRLLCSLLAATFLVAHHVVTPLHLLAQEHADGHVHAATGEAHEHSHPHPHPHSEAPGDEPQRSPHEPHPSSDHQVTGTSLRSSPTLVLILAVLPVRYSTELLDPAPRLFRVHDLLLRPRPPPAASPRQPRAPPAA